MNRFRQYLELKNYHQNTIANLLKIVNEYLNYHGEAQQYLDYLANRNNKNNPKKKLSPNTLNNHIYGLKVYFDYLETIQKQSVSLKFLNYKRTLKPIEILTIEEIQLLFSVAQNSRERAVLACLYHLGLRISEAAFLLVEDFDFKENLVLIRKSKTGRQRQVPLSGKATEIFLNYLEDRRSPPLGDLGGFLQGLHGNLTSDGIAQILRRIVKKSGLTKKVNPHLLRHSIATHLLQSGMELEKVSLFLGHHSIESTQRYTHISNDL